MKNKKMYELVYEIVAEYKRVMSIDEALDGDAVDVLSNTIKEIINMHEANV